MCLGVPGRITETQETEPWRMATVDFGGISREVCLAYVPEADVGDYVIVHAGFAISEVDESEAQETLDLLVECGLLEEDLRPV
ncbi:MAG: HypC/HybG/HupF family hydrogenase formation chaperone [Chloroflexota bacterium]